MSCFKKKISNPEEEKANQRITKELEAEKKRMAKEVKLLLLGAGESGKSTIAKQMKIIHKNGFADDERKSYLAIVNNNVIGSIKSLIRACRELNINIEQEEVAHRVDSELDEFASINLTPALAKDIRILWEDPGIKEAYSQSNKFQLIDSAAYFLSKVEEIAAAGYIPSEKDVLHCRAKTTGIIETEFELEGYKFKYPQNTHANTHSLSFSLSFFLLLLFQWNEEEKLTRTHPIE
jgi:hypothetical protein